MELKAGLEQVGLIQSPFDSCAFVLPHPTTKRTEGLIGVHVDDGPCCGSEYFKQKLQELAKRFPFGSHEKCMFIFTGLRSEQQEDYSIHINPAQYIKISLQQPVMGTKKPTWVSSFGMRETLTPCHDFSMPLWTGVLICAQDWVGYKVK